MMTMKQISPRLKQPNLKQQKKQTMLSSTMMTILP